MSVPERGTYLGVQTKTTSLVVTKTPSSQIFDLEQIRVMYVTVTLTAVNPDTLTPGVDFVCTPDGNGVDVTGRGRDGITYVSTGFGLAAYDGSQPLPLEAPNQQIIPRYFKVAPGILLPDLVTPYVGARNPTANYTIYLEYV